jgi:hypothetical protein
MKPSLEKVYETMLEAEREKVNKQRSYTFKFIQDGKYEQPMDETVRTKNKQQNERPFLEEIMSNPIKWMIRLEKDGKVDEGLHVMIREHPSQWKRIAHKCLVGTARKSNELRRIL